MPELQQLLAKIKTRLHKEEADISKAHERIDTLRVVEMEIEAAIERENKKPQHD